MSVHIQCQASIYTLSLCRGHPWRVRLAKQETLTPPGTWSHLWFAGVRECRPWCSIVGATCTVTVHQFFCILHFCHTCSLCRVELVLQFPARGSTQVFNVFFLVCCGCDTSYIVSVHIQCQASIYTMSRAFMAGAASQGDADSSRAPCVTSGLQGSVNVHRCALLLVPQ